MLSTETLAAAGGRLVLSAAAVGMATAAADAAATGFATAASRNTETTASTARLLLDMDALNASRRVDKTVELIVALQVLGFMGFGVLTFLPSVNLSQEAHVGCSSFTRGC